MHAFRISPKGPGQLVVAVSGLERGAAAQCGNATAAALRRAHPRLRVIGLAVDALDSGVFADGQDALDAVYTMPAPDGDPQAWLARLAEIHRRERLDALLPGRTDHAALLAPHAPALAALGIGTCLPDPAACAAIAPTALAVLTERLGWAGAPTSDDDEASGTASPDAVRHEVAALADGRGNLIGCCGIRALGERGGIACAESWLEHRAAAFAQALAWRGPFTLVFNGGEHRLATANAHLPGWTDFAARMGVHLAAAWLALARGHEPEPLAACPAGQFFLRHTIEAIGNVNELAALAASGMLSRQGDARGDVAALIAAAARPRRTEATPEVTVRACPIR